MAFPLLRPARITSAGAILRRELAARGWTQRDLAEVMGRPQQAISEIVQGRKRITAETALELAAALGTSAEVWLRLDAGHQLRLAEERPETAAVRRAIRRRGRARVGGPLERGRGRGSR
jgi:HTH-type transcriptional regulator/antitoxin HigA